MRDLKFRQWLGDEMVYLPVLIRDSHAIGFCTEDEFYVDINNHHEEKTIVMQYTGIKDKNGVEIYEGDIVIASWNGGGCMGAIEWSDNNCLFGVHIGDVYEGLNGLTSVEVIGNIYENSELLA